MILERSFPTRLGDLVAALESFDAGLAELVEGGGNRTPFVRRFDESLQERGWGKRRIEIAKTIDGQPVTQVRGHEIDMFGPGETATYPGIAVEMEWNNKDPFFDRDLLNFQALHREEALAVGVVVTRGPALQEIAKRLFVTEAGAKYGESTTHWNKLVPRVDLGGGGECPLLLIGIEPAAIAGFEPAVEAFRALAEAERRRASWRVHFGSRREAELAVADALAAARALVSRYPQL